MEERLRDEPKEPRSEREVAFVEALKLFPVPSNQAADKKLERVFRLEERRIITQIMGGRELQKLTNNFHV